MESCWSAGESRCELEAAVECSGQELVHQTAGRSGGAGTRVILLLGAQALREMPTSDQLLISTWKPILVEHETRIFRLFHTVHAGIDWGVLFGIPLARSLRFAPSLRDLPLQRRKPRLVRIMQIRHRFQHLHRIPRQSPQRWPFLRTTLYDGFNYGCRIRSLFDVDDVLFALPLCVARVGVGFFGEDAEVHHGGFEGTGSDGDELDVEWFEFVSMNNDSGTRSVVLRGDHER